MLFEESLLIHATLLLSIDIAISHDASCGYGAMVYVRRVLKLAWCIWHGAYSKVQNKNNGIHSTIAPQWIFV